MNEKQNALSFSQVAIRFYKEDLKQPFPSLIVDKTELKNSNLTELKNELALLKFNFIEMLNAPAPFDSYPIEYKKNKFFIYSTSFTR